MKMFDSKFNVRFDAIQMNDRPGREFYGYIYDPVSRKQKKWNTHESSKRKALKVVKAKIEEIYGSGETIENHTSTNEPTKVKTIIERYFNEYYIPIKIKDKPPHKKRKLISSIKAQSKCPIRYLGDKSVMNLDRDDIDGYIRKRLEEGAANATANREIAIMKAAINRKWKRASQVMDNIKGHARLKENVRKGTIKLEEFDKLVEELPDYMKLMVRIIHFTGARPGEIRELRWEQVDFKECRLNFDWSDTKEAYDRSIKLSDELIVELQALWKMADKDDKGVPICPWVFQGPYRRNKLITEKTYYDAWNNACERLGPPFVKLDKLTKSGKPKATYSPHDLRRTRITMAINSKENPKTIMLQTGHKTMAVFQRYNIVSNEDQDALVERQKENDEKLRHKEEKTNERFEERTVEAIKKLEGLYWTVDDDVKESLKTVVNQLRGSKIELEDELFEID
jgi:integrase